MIRHRIAAGLAAAATVGGLLLAAVPAQAAGTSAAVPRSGQVSALGHRGMHLEAGLRGHGSYRSVRGHAGYDSRRHLDVSVWNAHRLAGRRLVVYVHGTRLGTMRIWRGGSGHFERGRGVPRCWAGTVLAIRTRSGALVATGTFHRHRMMR